MKKGMSDKTHLSLVRYAGRSLRM